MTSTVLLATFSAYLVAVFLVGVISSRFYSETEEGFFASDRDLGAVAIALSAGASDSSGWIFIGAAGSAYAFGIASMWMLPGILVGYAFTYIYVAPRLRRYTSRHDLITLPDVFEEKFDMSTNLLRVAASVVLLIFFTAYVAAQFTAAATAFDVILDIDFFTGILITGIFTGVYTFFGGFKGVVWTDVVQGLLMASVLIIFPIMLILQLGGWGAFITEIGQTDPILLNAFGGQTGVAALNFIIGFAGIGLLYPGAPHFLQRFIGSDSDESIEGAAVIGVTWVIIVMTGSNLLGIIGRTMYSPSELANQEYVFPRLVLDTMPPVLAGIVLAAIIAAVMSSADSFLMMISQTVTRDVFVGIFNKKYDQNTSVWIGRIAISIVAVFGVAVAALRVDSVFWFVLYAGAGLSSAFGPSLVLSFYWDNMTKWGALAGVITGPLTIVIWSYIPVLSSLYELVPGVIVGTISILVVSKATSVHETSEPSPKPAND